MAFEYLRYVWNMRPRKLETNINYTHKDLYYVEKEYAELCKLLKLRSKPVIYLIARWFIIFNQPSGHYIYKKRHSTIYLTNSGDKTVFYLAHEMFHQYQHEQYPLEFKKNNVSRFREKHEIDAE